jgi:hypothetical protein
VADVEMADAAENTSKKR